MCNASRVSTGERPFPLHHHSIILILICIFTDLQKEILSKEEADGILIVQKETRQTAVRKINLPDWSSYNDRISKIYAKVYNKVQQVFETTGLSGSILVIHIQFTFRYLFIFLITQLI